MYVQRELVTLLAMCPRGSVLLGHISNREVEYSGTIFVRSKDNQWAAHAVDADPFRLVQELRRQIELQLPTALHSNLQTVSIHAGHGSA